MRARFLRPVSALIRLDLPTLERPANAISIPRIGGSETAEPAAAVKPPSPVNRCRPGSISSRLNLSIGGTLNEIAERWVPGDPERRSGGASEEHYCCGFFFTNT